MQLLTVAFHVILALKNIDLVYDGISICFYVLDYKVLVIICILGNLRNMR